MNKEILFVLFLAGGLLIPPAFFGLWALFSVFVVFFVCFGLVEWYNVVASGKTVSQKFWEWSKNNKVKAWIVLAGMLIAWLALLYHLAVKII